MDVTEMRTILVEKHGYSKEEADSIKGKRNLERELHNAKLADSTIDMLESHIEEVEVLEPDNVESINITSPEWNTYVMSQFQDNELVEKAPNVHGLRRVVQLLLGDIVETDVKIVQCPTPDNGYRCTAIYNLGIDCKDSFGGVKSYTDAADSCTNNTDKPYSLHPVAVATTRAEARALRKALNIKSISAEEVTSKIEEETFEVNMAPTTITPAQKNFLSTLGERLDIDIIKYINSGDHKYDTVDKISHATAQSMVQQLNNFQRKPENIPEEIKGYDSEWINK